ncbi:FG-GAP-like repeat-containing protein [Streptomyces sp. YGL11-2]|uniref:FG-GAP-like repeat-containing protein n=1 Tax=Streptomyces sp. YGL11-2 TaxID=3414028 RepID=UPI003CE939C4
MPVPTEELKLEIVNAATGKALGAKAAPSADGALVVRDFPDGGPSPEQWQLTPVQAAQGGQAQDDQAYVIRNAASGKVLDNPAAADRGVRQWDATVGKKSQQWHVLPVEGEAGLYFIEGTTDGAVLDLADPGEDDTRIVLREYDDSAESQRWRFVPAEPERTSDPVLRWAPLSHWNSRQSWRLARSTALRPTPDATPSFSDMLLVLQQFGSDQDAGGWKSDGANHSPNGQPDWWAGLGDRFLADTTGAGRMDIVGLKPAKGAVTSSGRGDGTFKDDERVLHQGAPYPSPADLWTLVDTTGDRKPDVVVLAADGVRVSSHEGGTFAPAGGKLVLKAFGHGQEAGAWLVDKHPRFLADTTGDGRLDIVGCHDDGVWVSVQDEERKFAPIGDEPVLRAFGHGQEAGGWLVDKHPRFLADTTGDGRLDIVGCHDDGVWVSVQDEERKFAPIGDEPVLRAFGHGQEAGGWLVDKHPRFLADTTGDGRLDIVGCHDDGVWVSVQDEERKFAPIGDEPVLRAFGHGQEAGGWLVDKHPRFLADTTGDGRLDIVGCHDDGVWVSVQDEERKFAPIGDEPVLRAFGHGQEAGAWLVDKHPRFLADTTGDGRLDIVGCHDDGVWVSVQDEERKFAPIGDEPVLRAFGHGQEAGGWLVDKHPRFLADTTGDGRLDIVGCHDDGVWVSLQDEDGTFADPLYVLDDFGADQGWSSVEEYPRFLVKTTSDGALDIAGFGPQGVVVSRGRGDGTFEPSKLVLNDFGLAQGWTSGKHLRFLTDVTGDGNPDIVGFGDEGVWVSHSRSGGQFEQAQLVCRGFGHNEDAGGWRVDRHPRFLADITGDGRVDIVGFGGPGVYVARNLFRRFRTR